MTIDQVDFNGNWSGDLPIEVPVKIPKFQHKSYQKSQTFLFFNQSLKNKNV
jgi:hypothetical protein